MSGDADPSAAQSNVSRTPSIFKHHRPLLMMPQSPLTPPRPDSMQQPMTSRSPVIVYLRRLTFVVSLVLGSAAVGSWLWSTFLLPLLHASFSARKALISQQEDNISNLLRTVKEIRKRRMYATRKSTEACSLSAELGAGSGSGKSRNEGKEGRNSEDDSTRDSMAEDRPILLVEEMTETASHASTSTSHLTKYQARIPLIPSIELSDLTAKLKDLSEALDSTSTTRTSLLSTLELYTAELHREVFRRSVPSTYGGHSGATPVGLGTLSANLNRESGHAALTGPNGIDDGMKEFDMARKEIRAMKGILLGRRNFAHAQSAGQ